MSLLYAMSGILCHPHYDFSKEEPKARESLICLGNPGGNMAFRMFCSVAIEQSRIRATSPSAEACLHGGKQFCAGQEKRLRTNAAS